MSKLSKNLSVVLQNAKFRIVILLCLIVVAVGAGFYLWHLRSEEIASRSTVIVSGSTSIQSVPGGGNPTNQYVGNQNLQNTQEELNARKNATSAVPTITRPNFATSLSQFADLSQTAATGAAPGSCPIKKVIVMYKPNPANCTVDNLKMARAAGVTAEELLCQGCSCPALKLAGYTAGDLKDVGYTAQQLRTCGFTLGQLVEAGYSAKQLKAAGFTPKQLANVGFTPGQLAAAGYTTKEIQQAGFTPEQLAAAGVPSTDCSVKALTAARSAGVSASVLKQEGCGLAALKAAGYTAQQLKAAGFTAKQLKAAGFTAAQLKAAGFNATQLKNAGFTAKQLKDAGFSATALHDAGFDNAALKAAGFTPAEIKKADESTNQCNVENLNKERLAGVSAVSLKQQGCGLAALKAAGFSAAELKAAGYTAKQLKAAGFTAKQLHDAGFTAAQLKAAGFTAKQLKNAGFSADALKAAGFNAAQLKAAGYSAKQLKDAGFTAQQLKDAGYSAKQLNNAGFSAAQLKHLGFTAGQLKAAGFSAKALHDAGFSAKQLRNAGFNAAQLHAAGFTAKQLRAAGFTRGDLLRGGFTPQQAGYENAEQAQQAQSQQAGAAGVSGSAVSGGANLASGFPSVSASSPEARLMALERAQQAQMNAQQIGDAIRQQQGAMTMEGQKLLAGWSNNPTQTMHEAVPTTNAENGAGSEGGGNVAIGGPVLKAGSVMFAVLITSVDSDENTPVMAKIVSGPLRGSKLLGHFERVNKKVYLQFYLLNDPHYANSLGLNAVAIDPRTARTAVGGFVNNHYLLRYGTLFASAFLDGLSKAVLSSNSNSFCSPIFGCFTSTGNLSVGQQMMVGLGQVGESLGNEINKFNVPPTIKIPGGTGLGILLMQDLHLPVAGSTANTDSASGLLPATASQDSTGNSAGQQSISNQVKSLVQNVGHDLS